MLRMETDLHPKAKVDKEAARGQGTARPEMERGQGMVPAVVLDREAVQVQAPVLEVEVVPGTEAAVPGLVRGQGNL